MARFNLSRSIRFLRALLHIAPEDAGKVREQSPGIRPEKRRKDRATQTRGEDDGEPA